LIVRRLAFVSLGVLIASCRQLTIEPDAAYPNVGGAYAFTATYDLAPPGQSRRGSGTIVIEQPTQAAPDLIVRGEIVWNIDSYLVRDSLTFVHGVVTRDTAIAFEKPNPVMGFSFTYIGRPSPGGRMIEGRFLQLVEGTMFPGTWRASRQ
jgi:hypothetical protein